MKVDIQCILIIVIKIIIILIMIIQFFEAEVASTFNEQLLAHYLINNSNNDTEKSLYSR